ncbi:MAG: LemA family protein [Chitinophagales bacterium]
MADTTPTNPINRRGLPSWAIILGILLLLILMIGGCAVNVQRSMVTYDENTNKKWADVQSSYQRRADLIPNLVETVKGAADFEQETLIGVVEARAKATQITIDPSTATPEQFAAFQQAQDGLSSALSRLLVTVEQYPQLTATQNFRDLQAQLEGTENRINVSRNEFNEATQQYNTYIRKFPNNFFAGMFGFSKRSMFQASPGSEESPKVDFNTEEEKK